MQGVTGSSPVSPTISLPRTARIAYGTSTCRQSDGNSYFCRKIAGSLRRDDASRVGQEGREGEGRHRRQGGWRGDGPRASASRRSEGRVGRTVRPGRRGDSPPQHGPRHGRRSQGALPGGIDHDRSGHRKRVLLRFRRRNAVHPGGPRPDRGADAGDRQGRSSVRS